MVIVIFAATSHASIFSWSGGATDGNWSDSAKGFAGTPANGDTIILPAAQRHLISTNNIANLTLNQISLCRCEWRISDFWKWIDHYKRNPGYEYCGGEFVLDDEQDHYDRDDRSRSS